MRIRTANKNHTHKKFGSAIVETLAGICVLLPVFLLLVDVISLVIAQSINDDLAKQAARYAGAETTALYLPNGTVNLTGMATAAQLSNAAAPQYVSNSTYAGGNGLVCNATIMDNYPTFVTDSNGAVQVQVVTQITCNLPVPIPFGGPASTMFQAQATWPATTVAPQ